MLEVADILRRYGDGYLQKFANKMPARQQRAYADILNCRTAVMGGHLYRCDQCGYQHYAYHSCRNRSCPKCHRNDTAHWLQRRGQELLHVRYYHLVFTLPEPLRRLVRQHQKKLYGILIKSAAKAVIKLAADPHYIGGLIAVMCILHTWSRTIVYHPHVHCLIPAGGLTADRQRWIPARKDYLVPVAALSKVFRGIFVQMVRKHLPQVRLPESLWQDNWVVYCKPAMQGPDKVLRYLARYVHRVALPNSRITSIENGNVAFRYMPLKGSGPRIMTLGAEEFIRRFLQHVLPKGVHKVRYYGLWAPANRKDFARVRNILAVDTEDLPSPPDIDNSPNQRTSPPQCPRCKTGRLVWQARIPRYSGLPPPS